MAHHLFVRSRSLLRAHAVALATAFVVVIGIVVLVGDPLAALAQSASSSTPSAEKTADQYFDAGVLGKSGLPTTDTKSNILSIIRSVLQVIGIVDLVLIIYAGFLMTLAGGNPEKFKQGRNILFWAIVGTVIILSSLGIVEFIDSFI